MKPKYDTAAHCKYNLQYHIIWCPKFRFSALDGPVADVLKTPLWQGTCWRGPWPLKCCSCIGNFCNPGEPC